MVHLAKSSLLGLFAQAVAALASQDCPDGPLVCHNDSCLRAVMGNTTFPRHPAASQHCVSYFRQTLIGGPSSVSAVTKTATVTATAATTTSTIVVTTSVTAATSTLVSDVSYTTDVATQDVTTLVSTVDIESTVMDTVTATVTETDTATTTSTTYLYYFSPTSTVLKAREASVGAEAAASTSPCLTLRVPARIPTYASACSGSVGYSSACSCIGATKEIVTETPAVATSTVTTTTTVTPSAAVTTATVYTSVTTTVTVTSSQAIDRTVTEQITATATSDLTDRISVTATSTATASATSVVFVSGGTQICQMYLQCSGGGCDGQYIYEDTGTASAMISTAASGLKDIFQLDAQGHIMEAGGPFALDPAWQFAGGGYLQLIGGIPTYNGGEAITCTVDPSTLQVSCLSPGDSGNLGPGMWSIGPSVPSGDDLLVLTQTGSRPISLYAVPVNCVLEEEITKP